MAQFTLDSTDVRSCLISLAKRLADVLGWIDGRPRKIKIEIPDDVWHQYGKNAPTNFYYGGSSCGSMPPRVPCKYQGLLPEERAEVEILLGVLTKKRSKGK